MRLNLRFFAREALRSVRMNLLMSVTAVTTTFICVLALGGALLVGAHVRGLIDTAQKNVTINAFFPQDTSQQKMEKVRHAVERYTEVSKVRFVSKQQAYEQFKNQFKNNPQVYKGLGGGFLPASLEITLKKPSSADEVASKLEAEGFSSGDLNYPQQTIERLSKVSGYVIWAFRIATGLFLLASILLVSNTIRLSIFSRRKEIEVMKLVGASDGFVRTPFVIEGLVQGLVGAVLGALVVVWANALFVGWSRQALPFFPISSGDVNPLYVLGVLIGFGALIGVAGSFLSVRRFLRV